MLVFKSTPVGAVLLFVFMSSPAAAKEIPARTAGLWLLKAEDNPFADWSMCIEEASNDFLDTDVWENFANECKVTGSSTRNSSGRIDATCKLTETTDAKLQVTFSGDFKTNYSFESVTSFVNALGKTNTLHANAKVTYAGKCPPELKPGMKKMTKSGLILRP